jgi:glucosamine-6-phosphate deaminase
MTDESIVHIKVNVFADRAQMGAAAARTTADIIRHLLASQPVVNMIFAAAPSQNEFLAALSEQPIEWSRINALHGRIYRPE